MSKRVTLYLTDNILQRALEIASRSQRDVADILAEWLDRYVDDLPVEALTDEEVLDLVEFEMNILAKQELRKLLYSHRTQQLTSEESARLDELLRIYRRGILRKARAIEVAAARGLTESPPHDR